MKIMLLTAATGGGHLRAAAAVEQYIRENTSYEVKTVDTLKAIGRFLDKTVCDSYLFMAKKTPTLFGRLYKQTNKENLFSGLDAQAQRPVLQPALAHHWRVRPRRGHHHPPLRRGDGLRPERGRPGGGPPHLRHHRLRGAPGLHLRLCGRLCGGQRRHGARAHRLRRAQEEDLPLRHPGARGVLPPGGQGRPAGGPAPGPRPAHGAVHGGQLWGGQHHQAVPGTGRHRRENADHRHHRPQPAAV